MDKLAILLSTYNSSMFLKEQMDSILNQTYETWNLYIHDDMSDDITMSIIEEYCKKDKRVHFLADDKKRGSKGSFLWLLENVEADYYMFCDHDDVWLPQKTELSLKKMLEQKDRKETPIIVATNLKLVNKDLEVINESFWNHCHTRNKLFKDKYHYLVYNNIPGCSMLFNRIVKQYAIPCPDNTYVHDTWIILSTLWNNGRIERIMSPLMLYRQHQANLIGSKESPGILTQVFNMSKLTEKTKKQYLSSKHFTQMSFTTFFAMKIKYLMIFHTTRFVDNLIKRLK